MLITNDPNTGLQFYNEAGVQTLSVDQDGNIQQLGPSKPAEEMTDSDVITKGYADAHYGSGGDFPLTADQVKWPLVITEDASGNKVLAIDEAAFENWVFEIDGAQVTKKVAAVTDDTNA